MQKTCDHANENGLYLRPLPACLAPTEHDRTRNPDPDLALPREGDAVVITGGHVMFLWTRPGAARVDKSNSMLYGAPMTNQGCGAAQWDPDSLTVCDPGPEIDQDANAAIEAAWYLLIDLANQPDPADATR